MCDLIFDVKAIVFKRVTSLSQRRLRGELDTITS